MAGVGASLGDFPGTGDGANVGDLTGAGAETDGTEVAGTSGPGRTLGDLLRCFGLSETLGVVCGFTAVASSATRPLEVPLADTASAATGAV